MSMFNPEIAEIKMENEELCFKIKGDDKYGLDKSFLNAIRRTILNDIPSIAFRSAENSKKDITIVENSGQLHNEMLLQRLSLIPLNINPNSYMKNYLFELNVEHDNKDVFKFVTANDFNIYPLKPEIQSRIDNLNEDDVDEELDELLNSNNYENYDIKNPLSQKKKDEIFRPFIFRGKKNYCLITELKNTNDNDLKQKIHLYGVPSLSTGKENAIFQPVSCATYSFLKNDDLINHIVQERIKIEKIDEEEQDKFIQKLLLAESEKYYFRDSENECNQYNFRIKSHHYHDSGTLFKLAIKQLQDKLDYLKVSFLKLLQNKETCISGEKINDYVYHFMIYNEDHTMGNLIQSHIARRCLDDESILQFVAYKKPHPLEESIRLIVTINPSHKISKDNDLRKYQGIVNFLIEELEKIKQEFKILYKVAEKEL